MSRVVLTPDVLVLGAGVAGVPLAVALHRQGLEVLLVERLSAPKKIVFKGEYLQPAAVSFYQELGFDDIFDCASSEKVVELRFRDLDKKGKVLSDIVMGYPKGTFARTIHHYDLISGLHRHAQAILGERFLCGVQLNPLNSDDPHFFREPRFAGQHAVLGEIEIWPKWVVGADGRQSTVRKWMGGLNSPKNDKVVFGTKHEFIFGVELPSLAPKPSRYEVFRSYATGTLSAFSLGKDGQRIYYSSPQIEGAINKTVTDRIGKILSQVQELAPIGELTEEQILAGFPANTTWFGPASKGRFLLVGDASSVTTPYGGQGMTAASEHVKYLAHQFDWRAKRVVDQNYHLDLYEQQVERSFERISTLNFWLYYLFFARQPIFKQTTNYVIDHWLQNPEVPQLVMQLFAGFETEKPGISEVMEISGLHPSMAGRRAAQVLLRNGLRMIS